MQYDVFISYKSQYVDIVKAIAHTLEDEKIRCWYAPRDLDSHSAGQNYDDVIAETISNCKIVVVVLCNEALTSEWVQMEINQAQKKKKFIIPYVVSELSVDNGLRMRLESKHWIDAYPNPERKFSTLLGNIKILLNNQDQETGNETPRFSGTDNDFSYDFDYDEGIVLYEAKEYNDAILALLSSAERGNPKAKDKLCQIFYELENFVDNIDESIWNCVERIAKDGHCYANFIIHTRYYRNHENFLISYEYLKKAIRKNSIGLAFLRLGIHYGWGMGIKQNHTLAMHYYEKALSMGCFQACRYIGQEYEMGNDKQDKDIDKALKYYQLGYEHDDLSTSKKLANYYIYENPGNPNQEKIKEICMHLIEQGKWDGAVLMGDMYSSKYMKDYNTDDRDNAVYWYKEAAKNDMPDAFGSLAHFYISDGNSNEAYKWAKKGYALRNGLSTYILGYLYESDGAYEKAWECYMNRYNWCGAGSESLAALFLDKKFKPNNLKITDLVNILEVGARNSSEESLKQLITIHSVEDYGLKNDSKILEYKKLGATLGYSEQMFEYGLTFLDEDESKSTYNSFKGIDWIEKAAAKDYAPAILKLLVIYKDDKFANSESLSKWQRHIIKHCLYKSDDFRLTLPDLISLDGESACYKDFRLYAISVQDLEIEKKCIAADKLLASHFSGSQVLNDADFNDCIHLFNLCKDEPGLMHLFKNVVPYIYPDLSLIDCDESYVENEEKNKLVYALCRAGHNEYSLSEQDDVLNKLFSPYIQDCSYETSLNGLVSDITGVDKYWDSDYTLFSTSYKSICSRLNIVPVDLSYFDKKDIIPFFPSSLAHRLKKQSFDIFLSLIISGKPQFESLNICLTDEEILNIAETSTWDDLQLFLISYVELNIETDAIILNNQNYFEAYRKKDYKQLANLLNQQISRLQKAGIHTDISEFTEDAVESLFIKGDLKPKSESSALEDEFDRLLDKFLEEANQQSDE